MSSYENDAWEAKRERHELPTKLDISTLKYFWQLNPLIKSNKYSIPRFLRKLNVLSNFTDFELQILIRYLHHRTFAPEEVIFRQNEEGIGFYFLYSGQVDIYVQTDDPCEDGPEVAAMKRHVVTLERGEYFGELALLQEKSLRSADCVAKNVVELLGLFKPDMEEMIDQHPVVAAKLLQSISMIIANRLYSITREVGELKYKICQLEKQSGTKKS